MDIVINVRIDKRKLVLTIPKFSVVRLDFMLQLIMATPIVKIICKKKPAASSKINKPPVATKER